MRSFRFCWLVSIACLLLTSCMSQRLSVQTQYLSPRHLASYYINTPKTSLDASFFGQRLIIQWCLPNALLENSTIELYLSLHLKNHQIKNHTVYIQQQDGRFTRGYYTYNLLETDYIESGGILTYCVEMKCNDKIIEQWTHPLWINLLSID